VTAFGSIKEKNEKIIYTFLDLLTIAFLIGGYVFQYFTRKKTGDASLGELSESADPEEPCL
jgi:hypothetical protein